MNIIICRQSRYCAFLGCRDGSTCTCKFKRFLQFCFILQNYNRARHLLVYVIARKNVMQILLLRGLCTLSMESSLTSLNRRAPTNESPAPVVSTVLTWKPGTFPWNFCKQDADVRKSLVCNMHSPGNEKCCKSIDLKKLCVPWYSNCILCRQG